MITMYNHYMYNNYGSDTLRAGARLVADADHFSNSPSVQYREPGTDAACWGATNRSIHCKSRGCLAPAHVRKAREEMRATCADARVPCVEKLDDD